MTTVGPKAVAAVGDFIAHRLRLRGSADGLDGSHPWIVGIVHDLTHGSAPEAVACRRRLEQGGFRMQDRDALMALVSAASSSAVRDYAAREQRRRDEERIKRERQLQERQARREQVQRAAQRQAAEEKRRAAEAATRRRELRQMLSLARDAVSEDYARAESIAAARMPGVEVPPKVWEDARRAFVREWARESHGIDLDDEQADAVGTLEAQVKVVARAGSGKTRVLTTRALFLSEVCGVRPDHILLLVFNKAAQEDMETRLVAQTAFPPHVMTFDALAYALVHDGRRLLGSRGAMSEDSVVQEVIARLIGTDAGLRMVQGAMKAYFTSDLTAFVERGLSMDASAGLAHRYALTQETLRGEFVKSYGEKWIANTLFENDIAYAYEAAHEWNGGTYRPDFTLWQANVAIEYFGLDGDASYDEEAARKREYWRNRDGWRLIEIYPEDIRIGDARHVIAMLHAAHVESRPLTDEEIWDRCRRQATGSLAKAMGTFVRRARARKLSPDDVRISAADLGHAAERTFAMTAAEVLAGYEAYCDDHRLEDFVGQVWSAAGVIRSGAVCFSRSGGDEHMDLSQTRHVLIDELQDFTPGFLDLVAAVCEAAPEAHVFGVGDNWQAINRFAGAEPNLFTDNIGPLEGGIRLPLLTNYRSSSGIVAAGNALMLGRGEPAVAKSAEPGGVVIAYRDDIKLRPHEHHALGSDRLCAALLRIVFDRTEAGQSVTLLSTTHRVPGLRIDVPRGEIGELCRLLTSFLPEGRQDMVRASTIHGYKGLQDNVVVVVDWVWNRHPLIHPHWVFTRVLGDSPSTVAEDQRRVSYVGLTRAEAQVILVSERANPSPFDGDLSAAGPFPVLDLERLATPALLGADHRIVWVRGGFEIRDQLKARGFRLDWEAREWWRVTQTAAEGDALMAWLDSAGAEVGILGAEGRPVRPSP